MPEDVVGAMLRIETARMRAESGLRLVPEDSPAREDIETAIMSLRRAHSVLVLTVKLISETKSC